MESDLRHVAGRDVRLIAAELDNRLPPLLDRRLEGRPTQSDVVLHGSEGHALTTFGRLAMDIEGRAAGDPVEPSGLHRVGGPGIGDDAVEDSAVDLVENDPVRRHDIDAQISAAGETRLARPDDDRGPSGLGDPNLVADLEQRACDERAALPVPDEGRARRHPGDGRWIHGPEQAGVEADDRQQQRRGRTEGGPARCGQERRRPSRDPGQEGLRHGHRPLAGRLGAFGKLDRRLAPGRRPQGKQRGLTRRRLREPVEEPRPEIRGEGR